uniref:Putative retrotransposon protein n=1 Tax=Phyllostachys edulis TaxID=38705 RepID=D3IVF2_PHYED|nr:putative retrotransposon protein [Phyllostachys edulis]
MSKQITKWMASDLSEKKLEALEKIGMLPDRNLIRWRSAAGEHFLSREDGEIPVFLAYIECGLRVPVHRFLPCVLEYYRVELVNLALNSIANISIFAYLCEAYLEVRPNLKIFRYFYRMAMLGRSTVAPGECTLRLHNGKADEYIQIYPKSSWSSWKKNWFYMMVTRDDGLYFAGLRSNENPKWRGTVEKTGMVRRCVDAIRDLRIKGLISWYVVRDFTKCRISPLKLRTQSLLWSIGCDEAITDSQDALSPEEIKERIKMICAREPGEKAAFPNILAIVSVEERLARLKAVGLKVIQSGEDRNPTVVSTNSCPEALEEDDSPEVEKTEGPQSRAAEVIDPSMVVHDLTVVTETTDLEVDETTPSDPVVRNATLDQLVEDIASDLMLEDMRGITNPTGPELVKLVEKKRKASVVSDQNVPEDPAPVEVLVQSTSEDKVPEDNVVEEAPEQQTQVLNRAKKALEFEQDKEAALVQSLDEKIHALNKMIFEMGSGSNLPPLRDPTEKMTYLGQLLEDLKGLLKTIRENYAQTMKEGIANGVGFVLAKLKASDPSINIQAVEEDFNCLPEDANKFLKEMKPLGNKVVEKIEIGSPSSSN